MASNEHSIKYHLFGGYDGTRVTFNDPSDPDNVGMLTSITGLDSSEVREYAEAAPGRHGGIHHSFFMGRRPITLSGLILNPASAADRQYRMEQLSRATNSMHSDGGALVWDDVDGIQKMVNVRRQHPLRIGGNFQKTFTVGLVAADPRIYSYQEHSLAINSGGIAENRVVNPVMSLGMTGWSASSSIFVQPTGTTIQRVVDTSTGYEEVSGYAGQAVCSGTIDQGVYADLGTLTAGVTYRCFVKVRKVSGNDTMRIFVGRTGSPYTTYAASDTATPSTSEFTTYSWQFTATVTEVHHLVLRKNGTAPMTFNWTTAMVSNLDVPFFHGGQYGARWGAAAHNSYSQLHGVGAPYNTGNTPTPARIFLTEGSGTLVNPILANHIPFPYETPDHHGGDIRMVGYTVPADDSIEYNLHNHTIIEQTSRLDRYQYYDSVNSKWFWLSPGDKNQIRWLTSGNPAGTTATVYWRNAWI